MHEILAIIKDLLEILFLTHSLRVLRKKNARKSNRRR